MKRLVLIDGNSLLHRAYHAMPILTTSSGLMVNAVYGFANMLFKVFTELKPEYAIVTFDKKAPTFRHIEFKEYKAKRPKMDEELVSQIAPVHEIVTALNLPIFEMDGYEADDIIGTLALRAKSLKFKVPQIIFKEDFRGKKSAKCKVEKEEDIDKIEVVIVTGDRDTLQLVDENTKVYCPLKGLSNPILYDKNLVVARYGFEPEQLIDYKALRGDPSDNIPGVDGIGEVTATELIVKFRNLDGVYKNIDKIKPKIAEKLVRDKEQAYLSRKLGTIVTDVPIKLDLEKARLSDYDRDKAEKVFEKYEFWTLVNRLPVNWKELDKIKTKKEKRKKSEEEAKNQLGFF